MIKIDGGQIHFSAGKVTLTGIDMTVTCDGDPTSEKLYEALRQMVMVAQSNGVITMQVPKP